MDARGTTDEHDGMRTPRWLAHHAGLPAATASALVRFGTKLRTLLPEVGEAFAAGSIGFEHARVLDDACNPRLAADFGPAAAALAGTVGLTVAQTIDDVADELWQQHQRDEDNFPGELRCPSRATLEALALVRDLQASAVGGPRVDPRPTHRPDTRRHGRRARQAAHTRWHNSSRRLLRPPVL